MHNTCDNLTLGGLTVFVSESNQKSGATALKYLGSEFLQSGGAPATPLLTVLRRLWVENDSMEAIPEDNFEKRNDLTANNSNPIIDGRKIDFAGTGTVFSISPISDASSFIFLENGKINVQNGSHSVTGTGEILEEHLPTVYGNLTSVEVGSAFKLYDDDDYGLNRDPLPRTDLIDDVIINVYRTALVEVIDAAKHNPVKDYNPEKYIDFRVNHPATVGVLNPMHLVSMPLGKEF